MGRYLVLAVLAAALTAASGWSQAGAPYTPPLSLRDASSISQAITRAAVEGLPAPDLSGVAYEMGSADPSRRAEAEANLATAAERLAAAEHGMRLDPRRLDPALALRPAYDAAADFSAARQRGKIAAWLDNLAPQSPDYQNLVTARAAYAAIVASGGWAPLDAGPAPRIGDADPRAAALRQRLAAEGYDTAPTKTPELYDTGLAQAVSAFQAAHGLAQNGLLTAQTIAALNVPADARLDTIDANLERARWLPREMPAERIEVDTGDPQATLYHQGQAILTMRAIAGRPNKRTPTFASDVTAIEFNPPWYVPADIARKELLPRERASPGYLARHAYYVENGRLVQRAGPTSSLGRLKFQVPDPWDIYLHDTPARAEFARARRWLSHGCVRLANPRDLAASLLAPQGFDRGDVDAKIATRRTSTTALKAPVPVYIVYRTVIADPTGRATFRPDVYGWDAKLSRALASN